MDGLESHPWMAGSHPWMAGSHPWMACSYAAGVAWTPAESIGPGWIAKSMDGLKPSMDGNRDSYPYGWL